MFTGIVEEMGQVAAIETRQGATRLELEGNVVLGGTQIGDSISVNGVCLTVIELADQRFAVEAVPETLRCTNLGDLAVGSAVNLERAIGGERTFGGHYVQGHVDDTAEVVAVTADGEAKTLRFRLGPGLLPLVVPKGYVTVDGTSLTVVETLADGFTITLIPHTQSAVTLGTAAPGTRVNIEVDVMGKYVERLVAGRFAALEARLQKLEGRGDD